MPDQLTCPNCGDIANKEKDLVLFDPTYVGAKYYCNCNYVFRAHKAGLSCWSDEVCLCTYHKKGDSNA